MEKIEYIIFIFISKKKDGLNFDSLDFLQAKKNLAINNHVM